MAGPFKLKSGNSPLFKNMGSSPVKHPHKNKPDHSFYSHAKKTVEKGVKAVWETSVPKAVLDVGEAGSESGKVTKEGKKATKATKTGGKIAKKVVKKPTYKEAWDKMTAEEKTKHGSYEAFVKAAKEYKAKKQ